MCSLIYIFQIRLSLATTHVALVPACLSVWCGAVRSESGRLLTEVKACWAGYFEWLYQADPLAVELDVGVLQSLLLILQSTVVHLRLWIHRLR